MQSPRYALGRTYQMKVRLTLREREVIEKEAERRGISVSDLIRIAAREAIGHSKFQGAA